MFIKQLSIFVENKAGKMADVLDILGSEGIDISALSIADTAEYGIIRLIVSDPFKAEQVLKKEGMIVKLTDVIAVGIEDKPGSLSKALKTLKEDGIEISYMYAFMAKSEHGAIVIMKTDDSDKAVKSLERHGVITVEAKEIYRA